MVLAVVVGALMLVGVTVFVAAAWQRNQFVTACLDDPAGLPRSECEALDALSDNTRSVRVRPDGDPVCQVTVVCDDGHVTTLRLSDLYGELGTELGEFTHLTGLQLESSETRLIPPAIGNLVNLNSLYIAGDFDEIPPEIGKLVNLESLTITYTDAYELPHEIGNLVNLTRLDLSDNYFGELPATIGNLTRLVALEAKGSAKGQLGFDLANLTNLEELSLRRVGPEALSELAMLTKLTSLSVAGNQLTDLPAGVTGLTNLRTLDVRSNDLTELPAEIGDLTELRELDVTDNQIAELPSQIGRIPHLHLLSVRKNLLTALPPEIGDLAALTVLDVTDNPLSELPPEIGNLSSLTDLGAGNPGEPLALPSEITKLRRLEWLVLAEDTCVTATTTVQEWMEPVRGITSGDLCR